MPDESGKYTKEEVEALVAESKAGLEKNRNDVLNELKQLKQQIKQYDGLDVEAAKAALAEREKLEEEKMRASGDWKAREAQLLEKLGKEIDAREGTIKSLRAGLEQELVDARVTAALAEAKGSPKVLLPHVKQHVKVVEQDGKYAVQVVDANGNPRIGDAKGGPMSIAQFVEELKQDPDFARNFEGSGSSGGGASKSTGSAGGSKTITRGDNSAFIANLDAIADGQAEVVG